MSRKRSIFAFLFACLVPVLFPMEAIARKSVKTICSWKNAKTTIGTAREFRGWQVYSPAIECLAKQLQKANPGQDSPEAALVTFFRRLMKQRPSFRAILSPTMHPKFRVLLEKGLLAQTTKFRRFILHSRIHASRAPKGNRFSKRFAKQGNTMFGAFDLLVFAEGNTSSTDIILFLKKTNKRWYIQGFLAHWLRPLFKGMKHPWWLKAKKKKTKKTASKPKL